MSDIGFRELLDAQPNKLGDAAAEWLRMADKLSSLERQVINDLVKPLRNSGWAGDSSEIAYRTFDKLDDEFELVEHIVHLLSFIMSRRQSLRTRIKVDPDGNPVQVLYDSGEVALEVHDVERGQDPAELAESIRERFDKSPFDVEHDWPVRMAVIRRDNVPVHFAAMYAHMAIDGYGFEALIDDLLANLNRETGEHLAPPDGIQPLELARQQQTEADSGRASPSRSVSLPSPDCA